MDTRHITKFSTNAHITITIIMEAEITVTQSWKCCRGTIQTKPNC